MPAMQESVLEPPAAIGFEVESGAAEVDLVSRVPNSVRHRAAAVACPYNAFGSRNSAPLEGLR